MNRETPINAPEGTGSNQGCFRALGRTTFWAPAFYDCDVSLVGCEVRYPSDACEALVRWLILILFAAQSRCHKQIVLRESLIPSQ